MKCLRCGCWAGLLAAFCEICLDRQEAEREDAEDDEKEE